MREMRKSPKPVLSFCMLNVKHPSVLHILDSLRKNSEAKFESDQLEKILLRYFKGKKILGGRVPARVPQVVDFFSVFLFHSSIHPVLQVPQQPNSKDCACYTIYFAKTFFNNPAAAMNLIKVSSVFLFKGF
jgi:hypothetical protein